MNEKVVLERDDLRRTLRRIAHEIAEKNPGPEGLALVGIHTRGAILARRLHALVGELTGAEVPLGDIDISFYRDDVGGREPRRAAGRPRLPPRLRPRGRAPSSSSTTSSSPAAPCGPAIDALFDYGRPARVQLAVLCDRGHRELPIRPDYVGKNLPTSRERAGQRPPRGDRRASTR